MFKDIKIAHFMHDEKFPDAAYRSFEKVAPGCNDYFIAGKKNLKYIKLVPVTFINRFSFLNPLFIHGLKRYNVIILHSLTKFNQELVARAGDRNFKFVWIGMGYDYYDLVFPDKSDLYKDSTKNCVNVLSSYTVNKASWHKRLIKGIARAIVYKHCPKQEVIKRINYFAPVLENEYGMVASRFGAMFPEFIDWNYGMTARLIEKEPNPSINGRNILVGNSATPTNNHLEVFEILKQVGIGDSKVVCPLSYGNPDYGMYIEKFGREYFDDHFVPLKDFLPLNEYMSLIRSCSVVIMNHKRQQAGGNVSAMLYYGAKVFLDKDNPLYSFYKKKGAKLFTIEDIMDTSESYMTPLSDDDILRNRSVVRSEYCQDNIDYKTEMLISTVLGDRKKV